MVERIGDGVWKIPPDLPHQAQRHDLRKAQDQAIELRSHLPIEQQVRTLGATWLDRQLLDEGKALAPQGFGAQARGAMQQRADFLAEQGLAERRGQRIVFARNLPATLRDRELASAGKTLEAQTGRSYRPFKDGQQASGVYRQSIQLASGRFAMLDDGLGFTPVPWNPVIEQRRGQHLSCPWHCAPPAGHETGAALARLPAQGPPRRAEQAIPLPALRSNARAGGGAKRLRECFISQLSIALRATRRA